MQLSFEEDEDKYVSRVGLKKRSQSYNDVRRVHDSPQASPISSHILVSGLDLGPLAQRFNPKESFNLELSPEQREALFQLCDTDRDGYVDVTSLQRTLVLMGVNLTQDEITSSLGADSSAGVSASSDSIQIDRELFGKAVTRGLFTDAERMLQSDAKNVRVITYTPMWLRDCMCAASDQSSDLYATTLEHNVRWIDLGRNDVALRRLGISYKLHPDAVTDCLEQKGTAKVMTVQGVCHDGAAD